MDTLLSPDGSLASLAVAAFLAATLLPFPSEAALFAVMRLHPGLFWIAIFVATLANTAGGMTNYLIGRAVNKAVNNAVDKSLDGAVDRAPPQAKPPRQLARVKKWGAAITAFGWLPLIGEALCLASGWLRLDWRSVLVWQLAGRGLRYWVVAHGGLL